MGTRLNGRRRLQFRQIAQNHLSLTYAINERAATQKYEDSSRSVKTAVNHINKND